MNDDTVRIIIALIIAKFSAHNRKNNNAHNRNVSSEKCFY